MRAPGLKRQYERRAQRILERRTKLCKDALQTSVSSWAVQSLMTIMASKGACDGVSQADCEAVTVIKL